MTFTVRRLEPDDIEAVVGLQSFCFPPPFPQDQLWTAEHLFRHLDVFAHGQLVTLVGSRVVGSATNAIIEESRYQAHLPWSETLGGPSLNQHSPSGSTLYGVDISVHPDFRGMGVGRAMYQVRFDYVREHGLSRFATGCRLPGFRGWISAHQRGESLNQLLSAYLAQVSAGTHCDRTLTPLLKMGLSVIGGHSAYMEDEESLNCAGLLEWTP